MYARRLALGAERPARKPRRVLIDLGARGREIPPRERRVRVAQNGRLLSQRVDAS
jgi:hypothetical protein